jgi:hypothetical protein
MKEQSQIQRDEVVVLCNLAFSLQHSVCDCTGYGREVAVASRGWNVGEHT